MTVFETAVPVATAGASAPAGSRIFRHRALVRGAVVPIALALGWELAVRAGFAEGRLVPPPSAIGTTLWQLTAQGDLASHILATLARVATGFALGAVAGIATGGLAGYFRTFRDYVDPSIQGLRAIPSLAWVPLFILWLGIFEESKIALIALGVFFPVYLGVVAAVMDVDRKIVEVGRIFHVEGISLVRRILLPAVLPSAVIALRTGLGLGWMFVVAAEIMGASQGLGYLLVDGQQLGKPDQIVATILVFAVIGKISDAALVAASAPFLRWQDNLAGISEPAGRQIS